MSSRICGTSAVIHLQVVESVLAIVDAVSTKVKLSFKECVVQLTQPVKGASRPVSRARAGLHDPLIADLKPYSRL